MIALHVDGFAGVLSAGVGVVVGRLIRRPLRRDQGAGVVVHVDEALKPEHQARFAQNEVDERAVHQPGGFDAVIGDPQDAAGGYVRLLHGLATGEPTRSPLRITRIDDERERRILTWMHYCRYRGWHFTIEDIRNHMVSQYLPLVLRLAESHENVGVDFSDVCQECALALMKGIEKFDPAGGYAFGLVAHWTVKRTMHKVVLRAKRFKLPQAEDDWAMHDNRATVEQHDDRDAINRGWFLHVLRRVLKTNAAGLSDDELRLIDLRFGTPGKEQRKKPPSLKQIAAWTHCTLDDVKLRIVAVLEKLRRALGVWVSRSRRMRVEAAKRVRRAVTGGTGGNPIDRKLTAAARDALRRLTENGLSYRGMVRFCQDHGVNIDWSTAKRWKLAQGL